MASLQGISKQVVAAKAGLPEAKITPQALEGAGKILEGSKPLAEAGQNVEISPKQLKAIADPSEAQKVEAPEDLMTQQLIAKAIMGLAPALLGYAYGGAGGGAVGAQAGLAGMQTLDALQKQQKEKEEKEKKEKESKDAASSKLEFEAKEKQEERAFKEELSKKEFEQKKELARIEAGFKKQLAEIDKQNKPATTQQHAASLYAKRLELAEKTFGELEENGLDVTSVTGALKRALPEAIKDEALKLQEQAETNFITAVLRRESGAAISPSEFETARKQYFPSMGDTPEVLRQKKLNRMVAMESLKAEAGPASESVSVSSLERQVPSKEKTQITLPGPESAVAAPPKPEFNKLSNKALKKYLGM